MAGARTVVLLRYRPGVAGETARTVHLVPLPSEGQTGATGILRCAGRGCALIKWSRSSPAMAFLARCASSATPAPVPRQSRQPRQAHSSRRHPSTTPDRWRLRSVTGGGAGR